MKPAHFSLIDYIFNKVNINLENEKSADIQIFFEPNGIFLSAESKYELTFDFYAFNETKENPIVFVTSVRTIS